VPGKGFRVVGSFNLRRFEGFIQGVGAILRLVINLPLTLKMDLGAFLSLCRFPGFIRECDYEAGICKASISVRIHSLFTVITVNGLDIYFKRLSGKIDGVGFSPPCYIQEQTPESEHSADRRDLPPKQARM